MRAVVRFCEPGSKRWQERPLRRIDAHVNGDRWAGEFEVTRLGRYTWTIEAWIDAFAGWRDELRRKLDAGQADLSGELSEGACCSSAAAQRAKGADADAHRRRARRRCARGTPDEAHQAALDADLLDAVAAPPRPQPRDARWTARCTSTSTASARASAPGMSSSRARGAA